MIKKVGLSNREFRLFSERELSLYTVACSSVCRLSVTFVRPTQLVEIIGNVSTHLVPWPPVDIHGKIYGDRPRGTPPSGGGEGLNARAAGSSEKNGYRLTAMCPCLDN